MAPLLKTGVEGGPADAASNWEGTDDRHRAAGLCARPQGPSVRKEEENTGMRPGWWEQA